MPFRDLPERFEADPDTHIICMIGEIGGPQGAEAAAYLQKHMSKPVFAHIDIDAAKTRGIAVTNTLDILSDCTVDIAMTLFLVTARRAGQGRASAKAAGPAGV